MNRRSFLARSLAAVALACAPIYGVCRSDPTRCWKKSMLFRIEPDGNVRAAHQKIDHMRDALGYYVQGQKLRGIGWMS